MVVTYDIIQVYKMLVLSCGISLEGNCEDPKVSQIIFIHIHIENIETYILVTTVYDQDVLWNLILSL